MAAAALLRFVARKLARAPPHPRPLLARGLRDGARSGPGSLPPLTSDQQIQQGRLVTGMGAAAGAGFPSLATKVARAPPPQPHHRLLHERGLHSRASPNPGASGSTPPPTSDDNLRQLKVAMFSAGVDVVAACAFVGMVIYFCHRVNHRKMPEAEAEASSSRRRSANRNQDDDLTNKKLESELEHLVAEDVDIMQHLVAEDLDIMPSPGHGKQPNGGTRVDKSQVDLLVLKAAYPLMKEVLYCIKDMRAEVKAIEAMIKERQATVAELNVALESALGKLEKLEKKERCSREDESESVSC